MASVKNKWLGYLDRSFDQIKSSLLSRVTLSNPELTDHSDSNIFVIIIEIFAAIAEMLGYYIDNLAEESFLATAQRKSSVIKHTRALDYRVKTRHPEEVDLKITWNIPVPAGFTIAAGLSIQDSVGNIFYSVADVIVPIAAVSTIVPISQFTQVTQPAFGLTNGTKNQEFSLGTNYQYKSLALTIGGLGYTEVDTFAFSSKTARHFIVEVKEDGNAYFILGDGIRGKLEVGGLTVAVIYQITLGPTAKVGAGQFDQNSLAFNNVLPLGLLVSVANSLESSSGGTDYEALEDIRNNAVRSIRTLDRAVTRRDHVDILEALPGIGRASVKFCCGKTIDLFIVPDGGGLASTLLLAAGQAEMDDKKMVGAFPVVRPAGETKLVITANVTALSRKSISETLTQVTDALVNFGLMENQDINGALRLSDIQALIDNLPNVDFVDLLAVYTKPFARPKNHNTILLWTTQTMVASVVPVNWRLDFSGAIFRVFLNNVYQGDLAIGAQFVANDGSFTFTIQNNAYVNGQVWEFTTYPYLKNFKLQDNTILKIDAADLGITVFPAGTTSATNC